VIVEQGVDIGEKIYLIAPTGMEEEDVTLLKSSQL